MPSQEVVRRSEEVLTSGRASKLLSAMRSRKLAVVGDLVADLYVRGETSRISREAPVLVLRYEGEEYRPGGAANAIQNGAALGASVRALGVVGPDAAGRELVSLFRKRGVDVSGILVDRERPTATKTRILAGGRHTSRQQVIRIDREESAPLGGRSLTELRRRVAAALRWAEAVLVADYGLGVVSGPLRTDLVRGFRRRRLVSLVDSRRDLPLFRGMTIATPNEEEAEAAGHGWNLRFRSVAEVGETIRKKLGAANLLLTQGHEGMALFAVGSAPVQLPVHGTREATDVTGAGDTVSAVAALALAAGATPLEAAALANVAGGIVVAKHGAATAEPSEILAALESAAR